METRKTPEEIKKGLVESVAEMFWATKDGDADDMRRVCGMAHAKMADALAYIKVLEADVEKLMGMLRDAEKANAKEVAKQLDEIINGRRWIPVEERKPAKGETVLVAFADGYVTIGTLWGDCWSIPYSEFEQPVTKGTWWIPMPEPPEEERRC